MAAARHLTALLVLSLLALASHAAGDGAAGEGPRGRRLLVLVDDLTVRSSHSAFFGSLQARGFDLDFRLADDPKLSLHRYGQYLYDGLVLFAPSTPRFGGSVDQNAVLEFIDAGHDMILAVDSSASDLIRGIATECGVDFDEDPEAMVIDHIKYAVTEVEDDHTLIVGDDLIQSDVILGPKKIVVVRIRPQCRVEEEEEEAGEDGRGPDACVRKTATNSVGIQGQDFTFDAVADAGSTQEDIFKLVGLPLVENCLLGFNSSIFAYGQTGSGKTYTMWGPLSALSEDSMGSERGLTPRVFEQLFSRIKEEQGKHADKELTYNCICSFLEIYNEQITDLLDPLLKNLQIREDVRTACVYVESLTKEFVFTMKDVTQLLVKGLANRRTGSTSANADSSRSHCVFTCVIKSELKVVLEFGFLLHYNFVTMLNLRCLGIVFDLDETLIVANTTRSFEDRIDAFQRKLSNETDPQRINGMLAEIKRYQDDRSILKQYIEGDQVYDDGKLYKVQPEVVPPLSDNHQPITRPVIRLQDKNIILTRINPSIRDTSVLVRLRPAWEDLRSYLIARGRKRFEVYVCTMAERDYALEMWRLLDPDSRLINSVQLNDRMVCVKSGLRKSLLNVFHDGSCHPGMALVIDDRLKVWDEKDQTRVHVVPAFTPYYAPHAEANCSIPVLCVARNVACNVRGGFFKDFDEGLLPRISNVQYEDEINDIPSAPDVGNYLISEDENVPVVNGNRDSLAFDGMADAEVERRMKEASGNAQAFNPTSANFVMPVAPGQNFVSSSVAPLAPPLGMMPLTNNQGPPPPFSQPVAQPGLSDPLQGSPAREEGEVPESELDPDTRRRLLILQHGQDTRDPTPPLPVIPPVQVSVPQVQPHGNWFPVDDGMNPNNLNRSSTGFPLESDTMLYDKKQLPHPSFFHGGDNPMPSDRFSYQNQRFPSQLPHTEDHQMLQNHAPPRYRSFSGEEIATRHVPSSQRNNQIESGQPFARYAGSSAGILEEIALKCGSKVEYRSTLCDTAELQFSIEVWIVGEKVGEGIGRTRKEAQRQAAEMSLRSLADKYLSSDPNKMTDMKENGFGSNPNFFGYPGNTRDDMLPVASTSEESRYMKMGENNSRKTGGSVAALKELCTVEGYNLVFQARPSPQDGLVGKETYAQVEVGGQILGKGVGITWEEAKLQAADEALGTLRSMLGQLAQKRSGSPRSLAPNFNKRFKPDFPRVVQRVPYGRYSRIEGHVP